MALFQLKGDWAGKELAMVVRGKCLTCARNLAANSAGREGPAMWLDPARSTCELLRPDDRPGVLMRFTNAPDSEEDTA